MRDMGKKTDPKAKHKSTKVKSLSDGDDGGANGNDPQNRCVCVEWRAFRCIFMACSGITTDLATVNRSSQVAKSGTNEA